MRPDLSMKFVLIALLLVFAPAARAYSQMVDEQSTFRLAQVYEQNNRYDDAMRLYRDLLKSQPLNHGYFDGVRRCLVNLKKYDEAVQLIRQRMEQYPKEVQLSAWLGSVYHMAGDDAKALETWDKAIEQNPRNDAIYMFISTEAVNGRLYEKAIDYLKAGRKALGNDRLFTFELANVHVMRLHFDDAMQEYISYLTAVPSSQAAIQQHIAQFTNMPEALESALRVTRKAVADNRDNAQLHTLLAWLCMEKKDYETALVEYREIDRLNKAQGNELLGFGRRAMDEKAWTQALAAFEYLQDKYPSGHNALEVELSIARCHESMIATSSNPVAEEQLALDLYARLIKSNANTAVGYEARFRTACILHSRRAKTAEAVTILREIAPLRRIAIGSGEADIMLGDLLLLQGDMDAALAQFASAANAPRMPFRDKNLALFRVAELLYFKGLFDSALTKLEPLTENSSTDIANDALDLSLHIQQYKDKQKDALTLYAKGMSLGRMEHWNEGIAIFSEQRVKYPNSPLFDRASLQLGDMLRRAGRFNEAAVVYEDFMKAQTESILRDEILMALAALYEHDLHDTAKALECYQRLLVDFPNSIHNSAARERIQYLRKGNS